MIKVRKCGSNLDHRWIVTAIFPDGEGGEYKDPVSTKMSKTVRQSIDGEYKGKADDLFTELASDVRWGFMSKLAWRYLDVESLPDDALREWVVDIVVEYYGKEFKDVVGLVIEDKSARAIIRKGDQEYYEYSYPPKMKRLKKLRTK